jgi:hypothetical protein
VRDLLDRREEILEHAPRAEVDLGVDLDPGDGNVNPTPLLLFGRPVGKLTRAEI